MEKDQRIRKLKKKFWLIWTRLKSKSKDIAKAIGESKADVDLAVKELAIEDKVEYLYITTTFVALKGKVGAPE
jgi:CRISPR/Cas system-associated endonuclease Cas3-HD